MLLSHRLITAACLLVSFAAAYLSAADLMPGHHCRCPQCQVIEEIVYQDCITHKCELHPDKKQIKKTVYEVKEVPFCLHKLECQLGKHHGCQECCQDCKECECKARYKKVLIKKEIVVCEECTTKCVPVPVVTRVPVKVCRVIPCANCARCPQGCANGIPYTQGVPAQLAPPAITPPATTAPIDIPSPPVAETTYSISDLTAPVSVK